MSINKFQEALKNGVALVDFNANWCAPCKAQGPIIQKLINKYQNRASIIDIDIDEHKTLDDVL